MNPRTEAIQNSAEPRIGAKSYSSGREPRGASGAGACLDWSVPPAAGGWLARVKRRHDPRSFAFAFSERIADCHPSRHRP